MKCHLLLLPLLPLLALSQEPRVRVTKVPAPAKALVFEVTLPASLDEVWTAFTTSQGLSTWLTPGAVVDLRKGGEWTAHFPGGATGGGTIVDFTPKSEIVMTANAPPTFPQVKAERTLATWHFRAVGDKLTALTLRQTGWKEGEEWDNAYEYLARGNAQLLDTLFRRFQNGPIDWNKEWGVAPK
jgi:uncharacterized protein YndB with AHSA1/START domain